MSWGDAAEPGDGLVLPIGTVTMLLADVEGSSRRWEHDEAAMAAAMERLSATVSEQIGVHNGVRPLEQGEGDSFVAAFARPSEALACALEIGRAVELRLRIAVHTGEAQRTDDGTYVGPTLNRTGRLRDAAHGGQIVVSHATAELVADRLPKEASLRELGTFRLRDLARPERIYQLVHPDLGADFPPLRSLDTYRHNLPIQRTPFFGRSKDLVDLRRLVAEEPLVTLTGVGGCGKTRLSLEVASDLVDEFPDGVWFADLSTIDEPGDVPRVVARAIGTGEEVAETLPSFLRERQLLVILDNCEHVIGAAAALADAVLAAAPAARLLATSREPLRVAGETAYSVPSLPVPVGDVRGIDGLTPYAATELLIDRARRARADFIAHDDDAAAIAAICRRLDGIPLAIELAAARARVLSPTQIDAGLAQRFDLLTGGARTAMPRQQTLRASIDWSHALLTRLEQAVLRRVSVFVGGFTLDAAAAVAGADDVETHQVLDQLGLLVDKSLVVADPAGRDIRYRLLETIRQFAHEHLQAADEEHAVRLRHRDHYVAAAAELDRQHWGTGGIDASEAFMRDRENFEAAFRWSVARGDFGPAAQLFAALADYLTQIWIGHAFAWFGALVPGLEELDEAELTEALYAAAPHLYLGGPQPQLEPVCTRAVETARRVNTPERLTKALIAWVLITHPDSDAAHHAIEEATAAARATGDRHLLMTALWAASDVLNVTSPDRAAACGTELFDALITGDAPLETFEIGWRVNVSHFLLRNPARAVELADAMLRHPIDRLPDVWQHAKHGRCQGLLWSGRCDDALEAQELLPLFLDCGDQFCTPLVHTTIAFASSGVGDLDRALRHGQAALEVMPDNPMMVSMTQANYAALALAADDLDAAAAALRRAEGLPEFSAAVGTTALVAAGLMLRQGDAVAAEEFIHTSLRRGGPFGYAASTGLDLLAAVATRLESYVVAARLAAAADAYRRRSSFGYPVRFVDQLRDEALVAARDSLGDAAFEAAWAEGSAMSEVDAVAYARRGRGERRRPSTGWESLTPTEHQVVDLLAEGLSNREIADRLFMSVRTVTTHLSHVFNKLGLKSRTELVAATTRRRSR